MHRLAPLLALILLCACNPSASPTPAPAHRTAPEFWREDLHELTEQLIARHPHPFALRPRDRFEADVAALEQRLPSLNDAQVVVEFMRLVASLGDSQTRIEPPSRFHTVPFRLAWFAGQLRIIAADARYKPALGRQILAINGRPIPDLAKALNPLLAIPGDAPASPLERLLLAPEFLAAAGVASSPTLRITTDTLTLDVAASAPEEELPAVADRSPTLANDAELLAVYLPASRALYIRFAGAPGILDASRFAKSLASQFDTHHPARVVIDLRLDDDSDHVPFRYGFLPHITQRAGLGQPIPLVGLIGPGTRNAGIIHAQDLREAGALLVGQPTLAGPPVFSQSKPFALAHSNLKVIVPTQKREPGQGGQNPAPPINPDRLADISWPDYLARRDPTFNAAVELTPSVNPQTIPTH